MKKISNIVLMGLILIGVNTFADDIWFISPQPGQPVSGQLNIQIQPPYQPTTVNVWIEYDMGRENLVWRGQLTAQNNYTIMVDTSKFQPGRYELNAEYYINRQDFDGDIEFWIGENTGSQYYPPVQP